MRLFDYAKQADRKKFDQFRRQAEAPPSMRRAVERILATVRRSGDGALVAAAKRFDGAALTPEAFRVHAEEMEAAWETLPAATRRGMKTAREAIDDFNRRTLPRDWTAKNRQGARIGERHFPIDRVGLYIPRGLASTVLMTVRLAQLAKVPEIAVFSPCNAQGDLSPGVLAALHLCGAEEVYRIGGVAAIGAMAFGTETIRPVAKIVGPGNAYVVEAKRQVFGRVGIDLLPGPSEVMVIAGPAAESAAVAADLLAQAEHGSGREKIYLVCFARETVEAVSSALEAGLVRLKQAGANTTAMRQVLRSGFAAVLVKDEAEAAAVANLVAPEHLELEVPAAMARTFERTITTAGAMLSGSWSATALGDYAAGPSHVLPTGGTGRFLSGLRVVDFMRRTSLVGYSKAALVKAAGAVDALAGLEGMVGHAASVNVRLEG
ncbi:MAG: histidinol dehydrogenase [Puniceicoccaceae bacterium]|nr:MAG: histidinol dehydrogenase [Puniceicoccaceae bacterium]